MTARDRGARAAAAPREGPTRFGFNVCSRRAHLHLCAASGNRNWNRNLAIAIVIVIEIEIAIPIATAATLLAWRARRRLRPAPRCQATHSAVWRGSGAHCAPLAPWRGRQRSAGPPNGRPPGASRAPIGRRARGPEAARRAPRCWWWRARAAAAGTLDLGGAPSPQPTRTGPPPIL